ncbi:MAG TPA: type II toxin-antitoxin system VapC family toxin [Bryobacteraceae bacterium]|nr:type II toxin-antitoxin system VapC family toxin [Bryobacteraceae bacterium]
MAILIDSDVLIEVSRGRDRNLLSKWSELGDSDQALLCSPVTVAELWHGARPEEYAVLDALFAVLACVPIDAEIGRLAGDYLREFAKSQGVELGDALIGATATAHRVALWTRNRKHYPMRGLKFY